MNTRAIRIHHERNLALQVWENINQSSMPHMRCTSKIVKLILLLYDTDWNFIDDKQVVFKKKSLGAGIYDVWMEREEPQ